jgi:hypothetical protein
MTVMKMMFSISQTNPNGQLHIGDLVSDIYNATKCGVVVGPGQRGVKVSWWSELDSSSHSLTADSEEINEIDPLQLILLIKAAQC